jgi:hypothetical protein
MKVEDSPALDKRDGWFGLSLVERGERLGTPAKRIRSESATFADSTFVPYEIW